MKTHVRFKQLKAYICMLCLFLAATGCQDDNGANSTSTSYDPTQPITITSFTPESASGGAQLLVYGNNFGSNKENIKVTVNDKEAIIISSNGSCIYCFVPQKAGVGKIKVTVGTSEENIQEAVSDKDFLYQPNLVVKTLIGHVDQDGNSTIRDGSFEDAQFQAPYWLIFDDQNTLYLLEDYQGLRKIDLEQRQVTTLWRTGSNGIDHPRAICFNSDHSKLFVFNDQDKSDEGIAVGYCERSSNPKKDDFTDPPTPLARNKSCCGGAVHPETNDVFFNRWNGGEYFKWNFETNDKEQIFRVDNQFNSGLFIAPSGKFGYIVSMGHHCIYRTNFNYETGKFMQPYLLCGDKGQKGYADGPGTKAKFYEPQQGCFDEEDNFYVCDQGNSIIRKVAPNGQVTTFAGRQGQFGLADGDLRLEALFDRPHGIAYNPETKEFYIADKNNKRIRIITKE